MQDVQSAFDKAVSSGFEQAFFASLNDEDRALAAVFALAQGYPDLAAGWSCDPLIRAAAFLRLGQPEDVLTVLDDVPISARTAVLKARAQWQLGHPDAQENAAQARKLARQEGDAGAIVASAALLGEMQLTEPRTALRILAEGLKIAEMLGKEADPYLLAVLAHAQICAGGRSKGQKTAAKALSRSAERSPAKVVAFLALNQREEAEKVATAGKLGDLWFKPFIEHEVCRCRPESGWP